MQQHLKKCTKILHTIKNFKMRTIKERANVKPATGEKLSNINLTVPDLAMSVQEIMKRHANGLTVHETRVAIYNGEEIVPDYERMDLVDKENLRNLVIDEIKGIRKEYRDNMAKYKAEEQKKAEDAFKAQYINSLSAEQKAKLENKPQA